jgi:hypothetical protein
VPPLRTDEQSKVRNVHRLDVTLQPCALLSEVNDGPSQVRGYWNRGSDESDRYGDPDLRPVSDRRAVVVARE